MGAWANADAEIPARSIVQRAKVKSFFIVAFLRDEGNGFCFVRIAKSADLLWKMVQAAVRLTLFSKESCGGRSDICQHEVIVLSGFLRDASF